MYPPYLYVLAAAVLLMSAACAGVSRSPAGPSQAGPPDELWPGTGAWATAELARMTLEQKVSQLFSTAAYGYYASVDDPAYQRLVDLVEHFGVGGVIFFQGTPFGQAVLANDLQRRAARPLLVSQDMEWGAGMRIDRTTTFPRTMAVGATHDPAYAYAVGYVTAQEARALGVHQVFAPVADVNNNPFNPIINVRSFGEDPALVARMVTAAVKGYEDGGAIATLKHFPGHGDTETDSHADLPVLPFGLGRLDTLELVPFRAAIQEGVRSIMTGHLAFPLVEPDTTVPASLSPRVSTVLLRGGMGFQGLVVTDALNMSGVTKHFSTGEIAVRALEAGADMLLMSEDEYAARAAILEAVESGRLSEDRINGSVLRILRAKEGLGLHRQRLVDLEALRERVAVDRHRAVSEEVARRSLTLLRNAWDLLPLRGTGQRLLCVTLSDDEDPSTGQYFAAQLRAHGGAPQVTHRLLDRRAREGDYTAVLEAAAQYDVILVPAFVYVRAWSGRINLSDEQQQFLNRLVGTGKPVVLIAFGNPYIIMGLEQPAAYVAAYSASEASQKAAAQALFGGSGFYGRLPITIPDLYPYGAGLHREQVALRRGLPEEVGMSGRTLRRADSLLQAAIDGRAFPGAAVAIGRAGVLAKLQGYGYFTYERVQPVTPQSLFDLASLTKVVATTTAAMKLYEEGRLDLDAPVVRYLPVFGRSGKEQVTIRQLLSHTAGLVPYRPFHQMGLTKRHEVIDAIMSEGLEYRPGTEARYSDFGMITLALVIEQITGQDFATYTREQIFEPLGMTRTGFRPAGETDVRVVPTEVDIPFRRRLVQGEVHDETAWLLGGTAGHAGLFSTAEDLAQFAYMLMGGGKVNGAPFLRPETIRLFTTPVDPEKHTRALGWDTRSPEGYSSAGQHFGPNSFGHTGFTGTSLWIDPDQQLFVILLSNRVFPSRESTGITAVRPALADLTYEAVAGPPTALWFLPVERLGLSAHEKHW